MPVPPCGTCLMQRGAAWPWAFAPAAPLAPGLHLGLFLGNDPATNRLRLGLLRLPQGGDGPDLLRVGQGAVLHDRRDHRAQARHDLVIGILRPAVSRLLDLLAAKVRVAAPCGRAGYVASGCGDSASSGW